jgi:hypothetical protein
MESTSPMQLTEWLLGEVALLLIGLTKISLKKSSFDHTSVIESPLRLWALDHSCTAFKSSIHLK